MTGSTADSNLIHHCRGIEFQRFAAPFRISSNLFSYNSADLVGSMLVP